MITATKDRVDQENPEKLFQPYSGTQADLIPILQRVQEEHGYLPEEILKHIAEITGVPESTVYGVATFYARFKLHLA